MSSPRPKFQSHLVFMTFRYRIFVVFVFDKISKGILVTIEKDIFSTITFLGGFHWSKCTVKCAICLTLILKSTQVRCDFQEICHATQIECRYDSYIVNVKDLLKTYLFEAFFVVFSHSCLRTSMPSSSSPSRSAKI